MDVTVGAQANLMSRLLRKRAELKLRDKGSPSFQRESDTASVSSQNSNSPRSTNAMLYPSVNTLSEHQLKRQAVEVQFCGDHKAVIELCAKVFKPSSTFVSKRKYVKGMMAALNKSKYPLSAFKMKPRSQLFVKPSSSKSRSRKGLRSSLEPRIGTEQDHLMTDISQASVTSKVNKHKRSESVSVKKAAEPITKKQKIDFSSSSFLPPSESDGLLATASSSLTVNLKVDVVTQKDLNLGSDNSNQPTQRLEEDTAAFTDFIQEHANNSPESKTLSFHQTQGCHMECTNSNAIYFSHDNCESPPKDKNTNLTNEVTPEFRTEEPESNETDPPDCIEHHKHILTTLVSEPAQRTLDQDFRLSTSTLLDEVHVTDNFFDPSASPESEEKPDKEGSDDIDSAKSDTNDRELVKSDASDETVLNMASTLNDVDILSEIDAEPVEEIPFVVSRFPDSDSENSLSECATAHKVCEVATGDGSPAITPIGLISPSDIIATRLENVGLFDDLPSADLPTGDNPSTDLSTTDIPSVNQPIINFPADDIPSINIPTSGLPASDLQTIDPLTCNYSDDESNLQADNSVFEERNRPLSKHMLNTDVELVECGSADLLIDPNINCVPEVDIQNTENIEKLVENHLECETNISLESQQQGSKSDYLVLKSHACVLNQQEQRSSELLVGSNDESLQQRIEVQQNTTTLDPHSIGGFNVSNDQGEKYVLKKGDDVLHAENEEADNFIEILEENDKAQNHNDDLESDGSIFDSDNSANLEFSPEQSNENSVHSYSDVDGSNSELEATLSTSPKYHSSPAADDVDTESSADATKPSKLVTEVCACDTTTGSTEDEMAANKMIIQSAQQKAMDHNSPAAPVGNVDSIPSTLTLQDQAGNFRRREWAKELTRIRIKMRQKKQQEKEARVKKALLTRTKSLKKIKSKTLSTHADVMQDVSETSPVAMESVTVGTDNVIQEHAADIVPDMADIVPDNETDEVPNFEADIVSKVQNNAVQDIQASIDVNDAKEDSVAVDKSESLPLHEITPPTEVVTEPNELFKQSSNYQYLGSIEVVEDDDEEDEPWPFQASPPSSVEAETTSMGLKVAPTTSAALTTMNPVDILDTSIIKENDDSSDQEDQENQEVSVASPFKSQDQISKERFSESLNLFPVNRNKVCTNSSPSVVKDLFEINSNKASTKLKVPRPTLATTQSIRELLTRKPSTEPARQTELLTDHLNISPQKTDVDQSQHAKMQSRSIDKNIKNSMTDSMWRDMFNSVATPLDFDGPEIAPEIAQRKIDEEQLLPSAYKKSLWTVQKSLSVVTPTTDYINTPCGDSYPIIQSDSTSPLTVSNLKLCSCKSEGTLSPSKDKVRIMFCQAVDTIGSMAVNCMNRVTDKVEVRASTRLPAMVLCKYHRKKLVQHSNCPVCGLFCAGGSFVDCTSGKGHLHHSSCQIRADDGTYLCPHCGEMSLQVPQNRTCKRKTELQRAKQPSQKESNEGIARMCIRLVTRPITPTADDTGSYDSKLFEVSKSKLLDGAEKTKLINVMSAIHHLVPVMQEKLSSSASTTSLYDLSSYILKNDLSQLVLGICDVMRNCKENEGKFPLDKQFGEQGGKTLLHLAVQGNSLATVHCLVMAGATLNSTDYKGVTPLMMAAKGSHLDILKYLIGAGALVEWRDIDGMTPLHMASVAGNKAICEYLLTSIHANINCEDEGGWTPLVWAIENGHTHVVKVLLNADANIQLRDSEGNASIHWGAYSGNTEIIKLLITRGADIEAVNELGDRPLHIAVRQARTDAVILLLSHGVDTSAINNLHQTPAECCHGACSENMKSFLTVNDVLRSCKLGGIMTRSSKLLHQDISRGKERIPIPVTNDVDDSNYPTDFIYVTESVFTSPVLINTTISSLNRCNCAGDCNRASCACSRASISCWYEPGGVLSSDFNFTSPPQIFECNKACGCWSTCTNRVVQQGITTQLELFKTTQRGWGVRARHEILKGTFICEYVGELITDSQADQREDDSYLFDLDYKDGDTYCMDAKHYGNISRFINHRCEPNLTPINVFIEHQDIRFPRICLFSNSDIPAGTELGFDYGEKFWLVKYKHFLCGCGCKSCKYSKHTIGETLAQHAATLNSSTSTSHSPS